jgi:hypothetical protein
MSHMVADTDAELHAMARELRMRREWFQGDHYDVSKDLRARAIRRGAVAVPMRTLAAMVAERRRTGRLPGPDEALAIRAARMERARPTTTPCTPCAVEGQGPALRRLGAGRGWGQGWQGCAPLPPFRVLPAGVGPRGYFAARFFGR